MNNKRKALVIGIGICIGIILLVCVYKTVDKTIEQGGYINEVLFVVVTVFIIGISFLAEDGFERNTIGSIILTYFIMMLYVRPIALEYANAALLSMIFSLALGMLTGILFRAIKS